MAADAPAAHRAEEGCNPPPAILPIRRAPASPRGPSSQESSRKSFQESSRHLRGIYAAVFPLLQGTTRIRLPGAASISTKRDCRTSSRKPAGVCSGGGEIVKSDLPDSPSVICSLPCSALPGTPGASIGCLIHADGGPDHRPHGFHSPAKI